MLLYIIRHGDPDYAKDDLTEKGSKQAAALARRLAVHGLDRIYSSPLGRAKATARPTCELLGLDCNIEEWTSEALAWEDLSVMHEDGVHNWAFHCKNTILRNNETIQRRDWHNINIFKSCEVEAGYKRIADASDMFINRLGYKREGAFYKILRHSEERIAVFCHQGFGITWLSHLLAVPPHLFWAGFDITHSSVTILQFSDNDDGYTAPKCLCLSDISHIYKEGLPLQYHNILDI